MTDQRPDEWADPTSQHPSQPVSGTPPYGQPQPGYPTPAAYVQPVYGPPMYVTKPTNGLAIASLVCSLAGILVFFSAPVGAILGHVARRQIQERGEDGDGMALAGIIVGWIVTGLGVCGCLAYFGLIVGMLGFAGSHVGN
jgi:hypothetical protein